MYSKSFLSTTTSLLTAKEFCGLYSKIPEGLERVIFVIYLDLDFTNDSGTYIMLMSEAAIEDEWLLGPGAEFVIGDIKPEVMTSRSKERKLDTKEEKDVEKYLQTKDDQLSQNLVYKINMYKQPVPQTEFKLKL